MAILAMLEHGQDARGTSLITAGDGSTGGVAMVVAAWLAGGAARERQNSKRKGQRANVKTGGWRERRVVSRLWSHGGRANQKAKGKCQKANG